MDHSMHHAQMDHSSHMNHGQNMDHMNHNSMGHGGGGHGGHGMQHHDMSTMNPMATGEAAGGADAHAGMSHGGMNHGDMAGHMMMMYFHGGYNEVILFDFWRISSVGGLVGSMVIVFLMSLAYEGLKAFRDWLYSRHMINQAGNQANGGNDANAELEEQKHRNGSSSRNTRMKSKVKTWVKRIETNMWSRFHLVQTLLHAVQMILAYLVMLIFMTYNSWLCAACIAGLTVGYFAFGWRKTVVLEQSDHCH